MEKKLEFTDSAKNQIAKITKSDKKKYFRIAVQGGGCSGFKYNFSFDDKFLIKVLLYGSVIVTLLLFSKQGTEKAEPIAPPPMINIFFI